MLCSKNGEEVSLAEAVPQMRDKGTGGGQRSGRSQVTSDVVGHGKDFGTG